MLTPVNEVLSADHPSVVLEDCLDSLEEQYESLRSELELSSQEIDHRDDEIVGLQEQYENAIRERDLHGRLLVGLEEQFDALRQAEEAARVQEAAGNEGDADAIRRDALRRVVPNPASKPPDTRTPEQVDFDEAMEAAENASSPASEPPDDTMMLRHADGTPYMDVRDYHAQRGDPPRLRYGDSNQERDPASEQEGE